MADVQDEMTKVLVFGRERGQLYEWDTGTKGYVNVKNVMRGRQNVKREWYMNVMKDVMRGLQIVKKE